MENDIFNLLVRSQVQTMEKLDIIFDALNGIKEDLAEIDKRFESQQIEETKTTITEIRLTNPERNL